MWWVYVLIVAGILMVIALVIALIKNPKLFGDIIEGIFDAIFD